MHCAEWEQLLDAHLDGQLSGALRLEFDAHRLHCGHCQQTLAMMEAMSNVISNDDQVPALPANFAERVIARIEQRQAVIPWYRRRWVLAGAGLVNLAAVVAVFLIMPRGQQSPMTADSRTLPASGAQINLQKVDPIDLADYIWARAEAARLTVSSDLSQLAQIPLGLNVPDDMMVHPLGGVLDIFAPAASDSADSSAESDSHAL